MKTKATLTAGCPKTERLEARSPCVKVFLIHGMGRTPASMWLLAIRLRIEGHRPSLFGYTVTLEPLHRIAERLASHIRDELDKEEANEPWAVVGHSLGNIIARLASPRLPEGFSRFVMLAPPNQSPAMARELQDNPLFQVLASDAGQRLCDEEFYEALPRPAVPSLIIAGEKGVESPWHPLGTQPNDAVVSLDETFLEGVPQVAVAGLHTFLMNRRDVFGLIQAFLHDAVVQLPVGARIVAPSRSKSAEPGTTGTG